jgi:DNA-binding NarL/FixJ family response regulator
MDALIGADMAATRLLIVDDVAQVRQDLHTLLQLEGDIDIAGEAANGLEAINQVDVLKPDVVLMDLEMPVMDGYTATRSIKSQSPSCRVIALTLHSYDLARQKASQAGVDVFIEKGAPIETLVRAILNIKE